MFWTPRKSRERNNSRWLIALCSVIFSVFAAVAAPVQITEKTNPKIVELYQKLQDKRAEVSGIESKRVDALNENLNAMRENEQRIENRILGATTTLATGMGAMQAATGLAETAADKRALADMRAYLSTFVCEFGNGQNVEYGPGDVTLPGGNELMEYYNEYKTLAEDLRKTKVALGLAPGIESEEILERADTGLYDNVAIGKTSGMYASLARGILNPDGDDAAQIAADTQKSAEKLKAGAIAAGAGVVGGIIGNYKINKDAPKESSKQINQEYDAQLSKINQETAQIETELDAAIAENAAAVREYNAAVESARKSVDEIQRAPTDCQELFGQYITDISKLELVENETDSVPDITLPEMDSDLLAKCVQCKNKDAMFNAETKTCECPAERPLEQDGKCIAKPADPEPVVAPEPVDTEQDKAPAEKTKNVSDDTAEYCPAKGNALKSITDKNKVGDACNSDIISQGTITKRKNGTCTCLAAGCWSPYTPKNGQCIKDKSETSTGSERKNDYVDENGFCKPYKHTNWFFNNEGNEQISKYFNKICDDFAKAHNCKRKDLNTGKRINTEGEQGKQNYAFEYEWICNADSKDYLETQERINKRNQNLSYENVCNKLKPGQTTTENGIKRQCVGLFSDINIPDYKTQLELAKARIGTAAACSEKRETRKNKSTNNPNGYYTNCNTTNDKEHYTFIFSGVSNNTTSPENLMQAACAIYGVKFGGTSAGRKQPYCNYTYKSIENDPTCNKIDTLAQKFGYSARIIRGTGCVLDTTGGIGGATLTDSGMRSDEKIRDLKTAFGIDNTLFANISTNMDEWLYDQMKNIVSNEMKRTGHSDPLVSFECFPTKSFALDKGIEAKLHLLDGGSAGGRNVLTCRANGRDIDFVFQKLGHVTKRRANASKEGLTCIFGSNGKYDGRQCWGITEEDCTKLNNTIKEHAKNCSQCGANWLPKAGDEEGFCSLTKSTKVEKTNKGLEIAGNIAMIAGGAVLTVMSGGMAMPMLVTELALMGVELTGATVAAVEEKHMRNVAEEFLRKTQYCHDATCAQELLTDSEVHRILNLESNLDDKISNTIDDKMSELLGVIPDDAPLYVALLAGIEDKPNCNFWRNATAQCEWAQFWHAWANVAQFASLGVALGRSAVRFIHARQAITKVATQTAKKMTRAQAKRISEIDKKIATLESKVNRTQKEAAELKKLQQERNTILNKVGTKDADEVAKLSAGAYNPEIEKAQSEYQKLLKEREALAKRMGTDKAPGKVEVQTMDKQIAAAEKKLKDLGADVEPVEPLWGNKNPTGTKPKTDAPEPKPAEPKAEPTAAPKAEPVTPTGAPVTPQSRVYEKLGDKVKADIADIKSGKAKELNIPRGQLTDDEWKILKDDLAKDGLEITDGNMYNIVKKSGKADEVAQATSKADDAAKSTNKTETGTRTGPDIHGGLADDAERLLGNMGFSEWDNGVFYARYSDEARTWLRQRKDIKWIDWNSVPESGIDQGKMLIAMSNDVATKQGLRWSDSLNDFVRSFNQSSNSFGQSKLSALITSRKSLIEINGVPVRVKEFGANSGVPIVKVDVGGRELPFYLSTGSVDSRTVAGTWHLCGGIKNGKLVTPATGFPQEIIQISNALDNQIGDIRNVEHILKSNANSALGRSGKYATIENASSISNQTINRGLKFAPDDLGFSINDEVDDLLNTIRNQKATPKPTPTTTPKPAPATKPVETKPVTTPTTPKPTPTSTSSVSKTAGKWADATVPDPTFDIKVTPLELGGKKYYLKSGDTESLIQNEISRTKQAHELLKHNKIVTSVGVVEDDQTVLKAFMDTHPDITLPRTPDTQYFIMDATHVNTVEGLSDAEILGYLRNKPITIEEQNTILSEIQNMNNNGLIHNDIWHNFAIYRDSGGKLHMELMDFGDFTAEDKLLRSNDDVLEIKKLFSRWSDRGLVEKPATPKPTPTTSAGRGAAAGTNDIATNGKRAPFMTANRAERKNVAQIKKDIAPGMPDGYFDAALNRFKKDGQSIIFDSSLTTDEGWELLNKSIKEENIQLVDDGFGNKVFKRDTTAPTSPVASASHGAASASANPNSSRALDLDPNELVRVKGNGGKAINQDYVSASKDARRHMKNAIGSGKYARSTDDYIETMNEAHRISANGASGNLNWYADAGQGGMDINPGRIRGNGRLRNSRTAQAQNVEQIAKQYGDPFRVANTSTVNLPGIPKDNLPINQNLDGKFFHWYPDGGDALRPYFEQMARTSRETLNLIERGASERTILEKIAEHYQYAANARPYGQINNSLFMNETNTLLQQAGLRTMPHGELDIAAMHLQPDTFKKYFIDQYYATRL